MSLLYHCSLKAAFTRIRRQWGRLFGVLNVYNRLFIKGYNAAMDKVGDPAF